MQKLFHFLHAKATTVKFAVFSVVTLASTGALAQTESTLPAWTQQIATDSEAAVADMSALVGPVIGAMIVALVVIKLVKRFSSKI
ncbi:major coat protein [Marinimicrobium agarilyticum]|uniref:major coat protein n=1 Tax=Marinimicrobium agarilyticum TaxID=306546 RepID=UPI0003FBBF8B|nr:major coat protein [Marinimicrobium agarilyticum]